EQRWIEDRRRDLYEGRRFACRRDHRVIKFFLILNRRKMANQINPFQLRHEANPTPEAEAQLHKLGSGIVCDTERRGHASPQGRSPLEIIVDASEGFIPLWANNMILRWRFQERSMINFANPTAAKNEIRNLFGQALLAWV